MESVSASQPHSAIVIDPLRSCPATNTESDRDCDPDSDADTDSGNSTAVFMLMGAHPAHELLSLFHLTVAPEETYSAEQNQPGALEGSI